MNYWNTYELIQQMFIGFISNRIIILNPTYSNSLVFFYSLHQLWVQKILQLVLTIEK